MGRVATAVAACAILTGCGSSSSGTENGPGLYVGHASNAVMLIQWTRTGGSVTGSLRQTITKRGGRGISASDGKSFTGVINGKSLSLQVAGGETLVGQLSGSGFSVSVPGNGGGLITIEFSPGSVAEYDEAVHQLTLAQYSSPCTLYVTGHNAKIEFGGAEAPAQCAHFVQRLPEVDWTTEEQVRTERGVVCELTNGSRERAVVTDTGAQEYGSQACRTLSGEGWANSARASGEGATGEATTGGFAVHVMPCGTIFDHGANLKVTTDNGVSCADARRVFVDYLAGKGEQHEGSNAAESYTNVDGWGCGRGAGGFGCKRSGAFISATTSE
jgi:hypothetical protein